MARDLSRLATLREDIVNVLKETPGPIQLIDLSKRLRIRSESDDYEYLRNVLNTMAD
jgi:predicted Zn-ribbon and HTH transcriptional regulator